MDITVIKTIDQKQLFVTVKKKADLIDNIKKRLSISQSNRKTFIFSYIYLGSLYYAIKNKGYLNSLDTATSVGLDGFFLGWIIKLLYGKEYEQFGPEDY